MPGSYKITPTNREVQLGDNQLIISKTCPKGRIRYINRSFMEVSGFHEEELLEAPHSIIRHPEMPRGVFYLMWKTLQQGKEFFGFVKNLCRDGSYYWVFANITPDLDEYGKLKGYYSVRRKPGRTSIKVIEPLYASLLQQEKSQTGSSIPEASNRLLQQQIADQGQNYNAFVLNLYQTGLNTQEAHR